MMSINVKENEEISKVFEISSHNYGVFSNLFKQNKLENGFVCKAGYFAKSKKPGKK
jgi:hypothetical protein